MGIINDKLAIVTLEITLFYKSPQEPGCCVDVDVDFLGEVTLNGTKGGLFETEEKVKGKKTTVKAHNEIALCPVTAKQQCRITFKAHYDKTETVDTPVIKGWVNDIVVRLDGDLKLTVTTKKIS